jgi:organic radical activating enzyme
MSISARNNGDARLCCQANSAINRGMIKDGNNESYNLSKDTIDEIRNSELMKDVRLSMLDGKYHDSCIRCKREDEAGIRSRRKDEIDVWKEYITEEQIKDITNHDGSIDLEKNHLLMADLRFGNLCNLKCRMCGPTDSDQWYSDYVNVWGLTDYPDGDRKIKIIKTSDTRYGLEDPETYTWFNSERFWNDLNEKIPYVQRFYLSGGEPLLIEPHYDFLKKCIDSGHSNHISLVYNTNMTNVPKKAITLWENFKEVRIGMSIDGVGKMNEYIRYPSKWSQVEKNIQLLDQSNSNFILWWAATIQAYNFIHLPDMLIWKISQNYSRVNKNKSIITAHPLHVPEFLSIKIFSQQSKIEISKYFNERKIKDREVIFNLDFLDEAQKNKTYSQYCKILDQYVNLMNSQDLSHLKQKFWDFTNRLDESRDFYLKDVCEKTYNLLIE